MEEPSAELGIRKPVTVDRKTNLHEHRAYWGVRRAQDIFFSLLALIALSPLMLLTCIAVWIDSPGASPVFSPCIFSHLPVYQLKPPHPACNPLGCMML